MDPEKLKEPGVVSTHSFELSNVYSQRPDNNARFVSVTLTNGKVRLYITGIDISRYEDVVGPRRAADHRRSLEPAHHRQRSLSAIFMDGVHSLVHALGR